MLIRFSVKNFLSFASREDNMSEEFSMIAGRVRGKKEHLYDDGKIKLLKFAAVYGANAAGKSNLVKAMDFMKQVVIEYSCAVGSSAIIRYYCYIPCTSTLLQATACHIFHTLYVLSFLICY